MWMTLNFIPTFTQVELQLIMGNLTSEKLNFYSLSMGLSKNYVVNGYGGGRGVHSKTIKCDYVGGVGGRGGEAE